MQFLKRHALRSMSLAALGLGLATSGCTVHAQTEPVGYAEVTSVPVNVDTYPTTVYAGHTVYWVNDRWMYRDRGRWAYYRSEPPELYRQRRYVQAAPPAPAHRAQPRRAAPHPPRTSAPPATRVR